MGVSLEASQHWPDAPKRKENLEHARSAGEGAASRVALGRNFGFTSPTSPRPRAQLLLRCLRAVGWGWAWGRGAVFGRLSRNSYLGQRETRSPGGRVWCKATGLRREGGERSGGTRPGKLDSPSSHDLDQGSPKSFSSRPMSGDLTSKNHSAVKKVLP